MSLIDAARRYLEVRSGDHSLSEHDAALDALAAEVAAYKEPAKPKAKKGKAS